MKLGDLEKYSSAVTLSDMEIFVFPELIYSLVLANIMSPVIWQWRQRDCFKKLEGKSNYRKLLRVKQFIMDEYEFNLDLQTWGLTSKAKELKRFEKIIPPDDIARSNALFGYQGDKYYFDVDIRKHFGLDRYESDLIPYWKTETVEAMNAYCLKQGYNSGAGECVSLSTLYAAAAFIICRIPLEDICMILTPLHSQNFIDIQDGVLTNNRRLVTKSMWFNGTAISSKAQRALRNENITIIAHSSGYVHCLYKDATIDKNSYQHFTKKINSYLSTELTMPIFAGFLRAHRDYQKYFQFCRDCHGHAKFLKAEVLFHYEHSSHYRVADRTFDKLLAEVSEEDFVSYLLPGRIRCDELEMYIKGGKIDLNSNSNKKILKDYLGTVIPDAQNIVDGLAGFLCTQARLPSLDKNYLSAKPIKIDTDQSREQIIDYLKTSQTDNTVADLAFYTYRDMENCDWIPIIKAAIERNPVSVEMVKAMSLKEVYVWLKQMRNVSIYDGKRASQPDEVANYETGDGFEKALMMANIIRSREPEQDVKIIVDNDEVVLRGQHEYSFMSLKGLNKQVDISGNGDICAED